MSLDIKSPRAGTVTSPYFVPSFSPLFDVFQICTVAVMGFRIGAGLGPFSVSTRIGGGGGGGGGNGDGGGTGEFFPIIMIIAVLSAITAGGSLVDNLGYWAVFNLLPMILLWVLAFNAIPYFPRKQSITRSNLFLSSALSPLIYFIFMQKVPLIDRAYESLSGPEKQKLYGSSLVDLAPFYYWVIAILGPLVFIFLISLIQQLIAHSEFARVKATSDIAEHKRIAERDKKRTEQAPANAALIAERNKRRAEEAVKRDEKQAAYESKQKLTKNKKDVLEESLTRLNEATDKIFYQSPDSEGVHTDGGNEIPESIEKALRNALADVSNCLSACEGFLTQDQIGHHQSGLHNLRGELAGRFGLKDL